METVRQVIQEIAAKFRAMPEAEREAEAVEALVAILDVRGMASLTVDDRIPEPQIFVGMHRPRWEDIRQEFRAKSAEKEATCRPGYSCVDMLVQVRGSLCFYRHETEVRNDWLKGEFDTPVYCSRREMIDAMATARVTEPEAR